jgi:hypothetical protein
MYEKSAPDREGGELYQIEKVGNLTNSRRWGTLPDREGGELYQIEKVGNFTRSRRWGTLPDREGGELYTCFIMEDL